MSDKPLLKVSNLAVSYRGGEIPAVRDVSFELGAGEMLAIVGESGSGKSTTALSVMGLLPPGAGIDHGTIEFDGRRIDHLGERAMRSLRGASIGLVPQDPTVSLDPTQRVGTQIAEALVIHGQETRRTAAVRAVEILAEAGVDDPGRRARQYPHEFSGGMRQRVLIGIAWACKPRLIIADEPTSALDVTVQKQVLDRIDRLTAESGTSVVLVTHDLGVAAERAQHVVVMSGGRVVESGPSRQVLENPQEEYTRKLLDSLPTRRTQRASTRPAVTTGEPLVVVKDLVKEFHTRDEAGQHLKFRAVGGVDLQVRRGETLSIVGESGSGKSTTARMIMCLEPPTSGTVEFDGIDTGALKAKELRLLRRRFQIVHQNPYASLSPRFTLAEIIEEPMRAFAAGTKTERRERAVELLERVGLPGNYATRRASELSGGQRQRVAIARALALRPDLVVCDEPVSALDVTVQAQVLDLLAELQDEFGLSYLFISHDLTVVRAISDRVAVMRRGEVVETGDCEQIFTDPQHEYTRTLLNAVPA
ncbi:ABC transporter ATP-binding protein [Kineosporia succinea]|uniref:Peptide/nickel transport system ATP-binding protein n=1 Tax=Kineosporia succinea TaxID=84632 RepID=A0ABT9PA09_9ACTN|nr:ABC transporter ATP-binding protein [Kineosporia succinea]MDP9829536.1 peptide/nickel transport system ATP-binding protein [Kineosporia succinea]